MSIIDNLNDRIALEQAASHFKNLLEKAKADVVSYEENLKLIADKVKNLATDAVETVEEAVETVKEEVKKAAPKKSTKKADAKAEEAPAEEPAADDSDK